MNKSVAWPEAHLRRAFANAQMLGEADINKCTVNSKEGGAEMDSLLEQYVVDSKGDRTAVILSIERYEQLLEDLHDLAVVAERREEKPISLEEMKRRLKDHGLL